MRKNRLVSLLQDKSTHTRPTRPVTETQVTEEKGIPSSFQVEAYDSNKGGLRKERRNQYTPAWETGYVVMCIIAFKKVEVSSTRCVETWLLPIRHDARSDRVENVSRVSRK